MAAGNLLPLILYEVHAQAHPLERASANAFWDSRFEGGGGGGHRAFDAGLFCFVLQVIGGIFHLIQKRHIWVIWSHFFSQHLMNYQFEMMGLEK